MNRHNSFPFPPDFQGQTLELNIAVFIVDDGVRLNLNHHTGLVQAAFNAACDGVNAPENFAMRTHKTRPVIFQAGEIGAGADDVSQVGADGL